MSQPVYEVPARCPTCGSAVEVREVSCPACATQVRGRFALSPFDRLDPEQRRFALLFLRAAGNLREMERLLGISYPTVRKKLDEIIEALGGPAAAATGTPAATAGGGEGPVPELAGPAGDGGDGPPAGGRPALGGGPPSRRRLAILEQVRRGELAVDEALALLEPRRGAGLAGSGGAGDGAADPGHGTGPGRTGLKDEAGPSARGEEER